MCTCRSRGHYYLEQVDGLWIASDHWGTKITEHADKTEVRKLAEARGYQGFR